MLASAAFLPGSTTFRANLFLSLYGTTTCLMEYLYSPPILSSMFPFSAIENFFTVVGTFRRESYRPGLIYRNVPDTNGSVGLASATVPLPFSVLNVISWIFTFSASAVPMSLSCKFRLKIPVSTS